METVNKKEATSTTFPEDNGKGGDGSTADGQYDPWDPPYPPRDPGTPCDPDIVAHIRSVKEVQ